MSGSATSLGPDAIFDDVPAPTPKPVSRRPELTEFGFADHFVRCHGHEFRWIPELEKWCRYEHGLWSPATGALGAREAMAQLKHNVFRDYGQQLDEDDSYYEATAKFSSERGYASFGNNALLLAQPRAVLALDQFDTDRWKLVAGNGTLDLKNCVLGEHNPRDLFAAGASVKYVPDAECPMWHKFIHDITCADVELARYLQRWSGLCLTGSADEQKLWIFFGHGGNGKGVFVNVLGGTLGYNLVKFIDFSTITAQKNAVDGSAASPDLARLRAARLAVAVESEKKRTLNDARIKKATGKDRIVARGLYEKPVEYDPMFKLVLVVNDKPLMTTTDKGVKRRVEMLPFNAEFEGDKRKLDLEETLLTEREGILAWMVEGLRQYNAEGLGTCTAIHETTSEYIEEMNPLHDYVEDRLELGPDFTVRGSDLLFDLEEYWDSTTQRRATREPRRQGSIVRIRDREADEERDLRLDRHAAERSDHMSTAAERREAYRRHTAAIVAEQFDDVPGYRLPAAEVKDVLRAGGWRYDGRQGYADALVALGYTRERDTTGRTWIGLKPKHPRVERLRERLAEARQLVADLERELESCG